MVSFKGFDFEVLQLRYLKASMDQLPTYRPDGKSPAEVQAMRDDAETMRNAYLDADVSMGLARGELAETHEAAHLLGTQVYAIMKSRYREDAGSLQKINRLPVKDKTVRETLDRLKAISRLWDQLPNPPGSLTAFKAWDVMDKTAFNAVLASLFAKDEALPGIVQTLERVQSDFHEKLDAIEDFVTAALIQGRAQFPEGSPEREIIDSIPMEPSPHPPAQAVISLAQSPGAGEILLEFDAPRATMFDIFQKGPGDTEFVEIVTDTIQPTYTAEGLDDGEYQFKVVGQNSLGVGPASAIASVTVGSGGGGGVPAVPAAPTLTNGPDGQVVADWPDVPGATGYRMLKKLDSDPEFIDMGLTTISQATFSSLPIGETFRLKIAAVNTNGESAAGPFAEIEVT